MTAEERADVLVDDRSHDAPLGEARPAIAEAIRAAVLEERAACAALAKALFEEGDMHQNDAYGGDKIAEAISARPAP